MSIRPLLVAVTVAALASAAAAIPTADPAGDFLPSYTGIQGGDLDVLSVEVIRSATTLAFISTQAAAIGTTAGAFYVWGIDRGQGTERFLLGAPPVGAGVLFDSVLVLRPDGTGNFADLIDPANSFALAPGAITIDGATISAVVASSLLPSTGFAVADYTFNLWPRLAGIAGNPGISDFAPDASNILSSVPEPASWALLIAGFGAVGGALRRRRLARA